MGDENAELAEMREKMADAGRWLGALIGFSCLIRERLIVPALSCREYADDFNFLHVELAGDAALIELGVRWRAERHTTGIVTGRWNGTGLQDVRQWQEGEPCELAALWREAESYLATMDELPAAQRARRTVQ